MCAPFDDGQADVLLDTRFDGRCESVKDLKYYRISAGEYDPFNKGAKVNKLDLYLPTGG